MLFKILIIKGVQTLLKIFPSGIQMEHSSKSEANFISGLFFYPIKSIVYCGAVRFVEEHIDINESGDNDDNDMLLTRMKFMPVDCDTAQTMRNLKNPPMFVVFLKAIDAVSSKQLIECHVFVVGAAKTSMKLVECCEKSFNMSKMSVADFYKKYGNCPVIFTMKSSGKSKSSSESTASMGQSLVKIPDLNSKFNGGFFYGDENTPIELWKLFDSPPDTNSLASSSQVISKCSSNVSRSSLASSTHDRSSRRAAAAVEEAMANERRKEADERKHREAEKSDKRKAKMKEKKNDTKALPNSTNPYERDDNLLKVEKRVDPVTGQSIYVRYLLDNDSKNNEANGFDDFKKTSASDFTNSHNRIYDVDLNLYGDRIDMDKSVEQMQQQLYIRQEKTPSPIIVEQYVKKKAPQVSIYYRENRKSKQKLKKNKKSKIRTKNSFCLDCRLFSFVFPVFQSKNFRSTIRFLFGLST
jgi:hypothetical protein